MYNQFKPFGARISLGMDGSPWTGMEDVDYWILNARQFKQKSYGYKYNSDDEP